MISTRTLLVWGTALLLSIALPAQKSLITGGHDSGGKSSIRGDDSPGKSSSSESSSSSSESSSGGGGLFHFGRDRSESNESSSSSSDYSSGSSSSSSDYSSGSSSGSSSSSSHSSSSSGGSGTFSSPSSSSGSSSSNSESSEGFTKPSRSATGSSISSSPAPSSSASPKPYGSGSGSLGSPSGSVAPSTQASGNPRNLTSEGATPTPETERPLPGVRPRPLPPPPTVAPGSRNDPDPHATFAGATGQDSLPSSQPIGNSLPLGGRPDFQVLESTPKPANVRPTPRPFAGSTPVGNPVQPPFGGGTINVESSDPYQPNYIDLLPDNGSFATAMNPMALESPVVRCILDASDLLVAYYRDPSWCTPAFEERYDIALRNYETCYRELPSDLAEPWMWPSLLTFKDERNFWLEECAGGNPELQAIRDYLRRRAIMAPYLLVNLDATQRADWVYVDSAFAGPLGGRNYYNLMNEMTPKTVVPNLTRWVAQFPVIRQWPSYVTVRNFFDRYYRSDMWSLLSAKVRQDFGIAQEARQRDPERALALTQNAAWLFSAMRLVDSNDANLERLGVEMREFLRENMENWETCPLRKTLP